MPIAQIQVLEGRTTDQIRALVRAVTAAISESLGVKAESVRVVVTEVSKDHWGIGGSTARELGR